MGAPEAKSDPQNTGPIEVFVKMSSWLPRAGQEGPRDVQEVPRASQERPRAAQDRSKTGRRATKSSPRAAQESPRDGPRGARSSPRGQRRPQRLPGGSNLGQSGANFSQLGTIWAARPCFSHCQLDLPADTLEKLAAQARVGDRSFSTLGLVRRRTADQYRSTNLCPDRSVVFRPGMK